MKKYIWNIMRYLGALMIAAFAVAACAQNTGEVKNVTANDSLPAVEVSADQPVAQAEKKIKKVSVLGDSYSTYEGYIPEKYIAWYKPVPKPGRPTDVTQVDQTWWKIFIDKNGYELEANNSYSGSTICNTGYGKKDYSDQSFVSRVGMLGDPDMILVFGGTNDSWADSPLGEFIYEDWTPKQLYSYRPATAYMLSELQRLYPQAEVVVIINDMVKPEIKSSTATICDHYGVKYVQLNDIEKMSDHPDSKGMLQIVEQLEAVL